MYSNDEHRSGYPFMKAELAPLSLLDGKAAGCRAFALARELFPICRSITGNGLRQTLCRIRDELPALTLHEVPSGTKCFDWVIPDEWTIREAFIEGPDGNRVVDFSENNLHVVNYATPVDTVLSLEDLQPHLHSIPELPDAIPYVTSYYTERWGFCMTDKMRQSLAPGNYRVRIDSGIFPGSLTYGEVVLPGTSSKEIFLSSDVGPNMPCAITAVKIFPHSTYHIVTANCAACADLALYGWRRMA